MGRKRGKPLGPGQHTNFYIPEDIDPKILDFINAQVNLSKTIIGLFNEKIYGQNTNMQYLEKYVKELVERYMSKNDNKPGEKAEDVSEQNIKKDTIDNIIKKLDFSSGFEQK